MTRRKFVARQASILFQPHVDQASGTLTTLPFE